MLLIVFGIAAAPQLATPEAAATTDRAYEVMEAEVEELRRELRNAPFEVHRNSSGTIWKIKAGDIDKWRPDNALIWVTVDTSQNPVYGTTGRLKQLWRFDCRAGTQGVEVSQSFDRAGELTHSHKSEEVAMVEVLPGSVSDKVRLAFCPPELE